MESFLVLEQSFGGPRAEVCRMVKEEVKVKGMEALNMVEVGMWDGSPLGSAHGILPAGILFGPEGQRALTSRPKEESRSGCRHGSLSGVGVVMTRWWWLCPAAGVWVRIRSKRDWGIICSPFGTSCDPKHSATQGYHRSGPTGQRLTGLWEVELSGLPQPSYKPPWGPT